MIALDPEFVGSLAPASKLTDGATDIPYARLPRLDRLRVQGKADETEISDGFDEEGNANGKKEDREAREKRKMRGKGKSMKRLVIILWQA
jgi:U3 small nucleolar RNA-associated protein 7